LAMTDAGEGSEARATNEEAPVARDTLIGYASALLSVLTVFIYPLGFSKLWLQIYKEYTGNSAVTWYATALAPVSMTVGQALWLSLWAIVANSLVLLLTLSWRLSKTQTIYSPGARVETRGHRQVTIFSSTARGVPTDYVANVLKFRDRGTVTFVLGLCMILWAIEVMLLCFLFVDWWRDFLFLALFLTFSVGAAMFAGHLIVTKPSAQASVSKSGDLLNVEGANEEDARVERRAATAEVSARLQNRFMQSFRRWLAVGLLGDVLLGIAAATVFLGLATGLNLPKATIEQEGKNDEIVTLLTFSNGQWYGFRTGCRYDCEVVAIPDNDNVQARVWAEQVPKSREQEELSDLSSTDRFFWGLFLITVFLLSVYLYTLYIRPEGGSQEQP
jgi:hypothetical protein